MLNLFLKQSPLKLRETATPSSLTSYLTKKKTSLQCRGPTSQIRFTTLLQYSKCLNSTKMLTVQTAFWRSKTLIWSEQTS